MSATSRIAWHMPSPPSPPANVSCPSTQLAPLSGPRGRMLKFVLVGCQQLQATKGLPPYKSGLALGSSAHSALMQKTQTPRGDSRRSRRGPGPAGGQVGVQRVEGRTAAARVSRSDGDGQMRSVAGEGPGKGAGASTATADAVTVCRRTPAAAARRRRASCLRSGGTIRSWQGEGYDARVVLLRLPS